MSDYIEQLYFYREGQTWFVMVIDHTPKVTAMEGEANIFLDRMYEGGCGKMVTVFDDRGNIIDCRPGCSLWVDIYPDHLLIEESNNAEINNTIFLGIIHHNKDGAFYRVYNSQTARRFGVAKMEIMLDNVIHSLFGAHPKIITIQPDDLRSTEDKEGWPDIVDGSW